MPIRSACLALLVATLPSAVQGQGGSSGRIVDEGTFTLTKSGAPSLAESFRITRTENALQATAQSSAGSRRITSRLIADTVGLPTDYALIVLEGRDTTFKVRVAGAGGRLSATSSNRRGDESMREYPSPQSTIIMDDDLVHLAYFAALGKRTSGTLHLINPRTGTTATATMSSQGLEPIDIGGRSTTATHYVLSGGPIRRDFWLDSSGRLLRLETSAGLKAIREELPR